MNPLIIAEVKLWSPSGDKLTHNSWEEQLALAVQIGNMVSIHTNCLWGGSFSHISLARKFTSLPILAKGWHETDDLVSRALDAGADHVLVVGRQPERYQDKCFIEPLTIEELRTVPQENMAVWNSRDLSALKWYPGVPRFLRQRWKASTAPKATFQEARRAFRGRLCQASNIKSISDIEGGADAVLVGTNLESFAKSLKGKYGNV